MGEQLGLDDVSSFYTHSTIKMKTSMI